MFQRAFLRQSLTAKSALSVRSLSTASLPRRITATAQPFQTLKPLPPRLCQRYASTESGDDKKNGDAAASTESNGGDEAADAGKSELEAKDREIVELKDKYLRSVADFRNLQERTRREVESARLYANQKFAGDLIESIDNLDRALGAVPSDLVESAESTENKELYELYSGLKMTEHILMNTLKKHGLERFNPSELIDGQAQKFDPQLHEATFMAPSPNNNDGEVMHTQSKGFMLNGRVLRAAKVGVAKNE